MDSCHLFNFLFGTKKATAELSKCFTTIGEHARRQKSAKKAGSDHDNSQQAHTSRQPQQSPPSPLKQIQMRIAALAPGAKKYVERKSCTSCDTESKCGTYRATLVEAVPDDDHIKSSDNSHSDPEASTFKTCPQLSQVRQLVENPAAKLDEMLELEANKTHTSNDADANVIVNDVKSSTDFRPNTTTPPDANDAAQAQVYAQNYDYEQRPRGQHMINTCGYRRVVLYENQLSQDEEQVVTSSAEVYKIVSEFNGSKAKLRRISCLDSEIDDKQQIELDINNNNNNTTNDSASFKNEPNNETSETLKDKRSVYVRNIVQSFESASNDRRPSLEIGDAATTPTTPKYGNKICFDKQFAGANQTTNTAALYGDVGHHKKPTTIVKPLPPKTMPKTNKAKCLTWQLNLDKPSKIEHLFQDEKFLVKVFDDLEPLDRCVAAQVCRKWRNILYANQIYWKDLVNVIDCTQLRRDQLVECIMSTLQSAKLKQQNRLCAVDFTNKDPHRLHPSKAPACMARASNGAGARNNIEPLHHSDNNSNFRLSAEHETKIAPSGDASKREPFDSLMLDNLDHDDVWRIQELCNKFTHRNSGHLPSRASQQPIANGPQQQPHHQSIDSSASVNSEQQHQQQQTTCLTSKSSSIPSQISSTFSSVSLSSLLSPLSESSRVESIKGKLYTSLNERGFDAICLFGATDEDIEDLICRMPSGAHSRILVGRLNNCCISDRGLDMFVTTFNQIEELELSGCNEITNGIDLRKLFKLRSLIITDCINIADGLAQRLAQMLGQLEELTIQAYHLTDAFIDYLSLNADTTRLKRLDLPDCKEITNQSLVIMAKHLPHLEALSLSGSTKISDDGIEILAEQATNIKSLDLSWCTKITDASLECIACDLGATLTDLILDRNVHITDGGLGYLATMSKLTLLHIRWCPRISDAGLESVLAIKSLRYISVAGLHQITARSLLCLVETDLLEVELTNCQAVNNDLLMFLSSRMPRCNIIF